MDVINKMKSLFNRKSSGQSVELERIKRISLDLDHFIMDSCMDIELEFIKQPEKFQIRIFDDEPLTLASFLERSFDIKANALRKLYVIIDDMSCKNFHSVNDMANYELMFSDYIEKSGNAEIHGQGAPSRNMMLHIVFNQNGRDLNLFLHYRGIGFLGEKIFMGIPVSVVMQNVETGLYDPYRVYMTFSVRRNQKLITQISECRNGAIEKIKQHKELTRDEVISIGGQKNMRRYLCSANQRMKEKRWGDSVSDLMEAYKPLKEQWLSEELDESGQEAFFDVCYQLGYCYFQVKLYQKALYYLELANCGKIDIERKKVFFDCLIEAFDINALNVMEHEQYLMRTTDTYSKTPYSKGDLADFDEEIFKLINKKNGCSSDNSQNEAQLLTTKLGVFLRTVFDIHPTEISDMLILSDGEKVDNVSDQTLIWNYNFIDQSEKKNSFTAYISYRTYRDSVSEEYIDNYEDYMMPDSTKNPNLKKRIPYASIDKSKCRTDNDIIVNFDRQDNRVIVTVMVPQFQLSLNNNNGIPKTVTVRYNVGESLSADEFEKIRISALDKLEKKEQLEEEEYWSLGKQTNAHKLFIQGLRAYNSNDWGDVIYYFTQSYNELVSVWSRDDIDEFDNAIYGELCYKLGFCFSELKQYELSIYYLGFICNVGRYNYTVEYINSLVNFQDARALPFILGELEKLRQEEKYKELSVQERKLYSAFLNRRYGYVLIDMKQWDKAKAHFQKLLSDPECHDCAAKELSYINSMQQS